MNEDKNLAIHSSTDSKGIKQTFHYPNDNPTIWKFLDLPKLLALLTDSTLFFPSLETLCSLDPYECAIWPKQLYQNIQKPELERRALEFSGVLPRPSLYDDQKKQLEEFVAFLKAADTETLMNQVQAQEQVYYRRRMVCYCWHENEHESDAMWKIYAKEGGAAVRTSAKRMVESVRGFKAETFGVQEFRFRVERVRYPTDNQLTECLPKDIRPWLLKRPGFAHEKEVRIFSLAPDKTPVGCGLHVKVDLDHLADEVFLSPFNPAYVNASLRKAVVNLAPCLSGRVMESTHLRPPILQNPFVRDKETRENLANSAQNMSFLIENKLLF